MSYAGICVEMLVFAYRSSSGGHRPNNSLSHSRWPHTISRLQRPVGKADAKPFAFRNSMAAGCADNAHMVGEDRVLLVK
jgi:hypothetical protein